MRRRGRINRYLDASMTSLREYSDSRELVLNLTLRELRSRYKRSVLGWTWSLLNPLASVVIYTIVFAGFLKVQAPTGVPSGLDSFVMFLLCALVPWNFVSGCLGSSLDALVSNGNLIKKVYFPRDLIIVSMVGSLLVTFFIELSVLCAALLIFGNMVLPWLPLVLVLVALLAAMLLGVGMALSVLNVYFRDVKHFVNIALQILFYSAPIVYPPTLVPEYKDILGIDVPVRFLYDLNPLVRFIEAFRERPVRPPVPAPGHVGLHLPVGGRHARARLLGVPPVRAEARGGGVNTRSAITVSGVSKRFRLYHERNQSLKASVMRGRRARYEEFWALRGRVVRGARGVDVRAHRRERLGEEHAAQVHGEDPAPGPWERSRRTGRSPRSSSWAPASIRSCPAGRTSISTARSSASRRSSSRRGSTRSSDFAGIEQFIDTPVRNYSSGMYVRLGFSVAINVDPDILLVDEVLAVGDAEFQRRCLERFDEMRASGKTIVIVTHALGSVRNLCDELALLEHGQLRRVGPPADVIDEYLGDVFDDRVQRRRVRRALGLG